MFTCSNPPVPTPPPPSAAPLKRFVGSNRKSFMSLKSVCVQLFSLRKHLRVSHAPSLLLFVDTLNRLLELLFGLLLASVVRQTHRPLRARLLHECVVGVQRLCGVVRQKLLQISWIDVADGAWMRVHKLLGQNIVQVLLLVLLQRSGCTQIRIRCVMKVA